MAFSFKAASFDPGVPVRYVLDQISEDPASPIALLVRHAGSGNAGYQKAVLAQADDLTGRFSSSKTTLAEQIARREADVELFAAHVIVGWENVREDGAEVACTADNVRRFLLALIEPPPNGRPDVFDRLRVWARDPENFRGARPTIEQLGKR